MLHICLLACLVLTLGVHPLTAQSPESATALLDRTIDRMGGDSALRGIRSLRLDMVTQWLPTSFATRPFSAQPSYERNVELRDYTNHAWRNTRSVLGAGAGFSVVDLVRDSIAARYGPTSANKQGWSPLNLAYVDERRELFALAPERLVLTLRALPRLGTLADTLLDGERHARLTATVDASPVTLFVRRRDALPVMVRTTADAAADFGLAPWGRHEVEYWYSGWQRGAGGVLLPTQRDVRRVGQAYKRMTVLALEINAPAPADSFAISDSLTKAYLASERRPMWRVDVTSMGRVVQEHFAVTPPMLGSPGAVRIGGTWVVFETAQHEGALGLMREWLATLAPTVPIGAGIAAMPATANGGARWFASNRSSPLFIAPGAAPYVQRITGRSSAGTVVSTARWARIGSDSLWLEPFDAPNVSGALAVYSPTLRWLYLPTANAPAQDAEQAALIARLRARGLPVEFIGSARRLVSPMQATR